MSKDSKKGSSKKKKDEPREAPKPPEDDISEDLEGEDLEDEKEPEEDEKEEDEGSSDEEADEEEDEEEEGEDEDDDDDDEDGEEDDEEEEDSKKKKGSKKKGSGKKDSKDTSKFVNVGMILAIISLVILGIKIVVDIIGWFFSFAAWCISCMLWPLYAFGWIPALVAIGLGIYALVTNKGADNKKAIMVIILGGSYIVLGIGWAIIDWVMSTFVF